MDVILHEIGHMLGLLHEHQNPANQIQWNVQVLNEVLSGAPNFWTPKIIERNIIERYSTNRVTGTVFDPSSIMLYPIDASWTLNGFSTGWNTTLSQLDIQHIRTLYPFPKTVTNTSPIVQAVEDGSTLITNQTDDPNNPIIMNEGIQARQLTAGGLLLGLAAGGLAINQIVKLFRQ